MWRENKNLEWVHGIVGSFGLNYISLSKTLTYLFAYKLDSYEIDIIIIFKSLILMNPRRIAH